MFFCFSLERGLLVTACVCLPACVCVAQLEYDAQMQRFDDASFSAGKRALERSLSKFTRHVNERRPCVFCVAVTLLYDHA
jgi:hypothetical protein